MQKQAMTLVATIRFHILATLTTGLIGEEANAMKGLIEWDESAASSFFIIDLAKWRVKTEKDVEP